MQVAYRVPKVLLVFVTSLFFLLVYAQVMGESGAGKTTRELASRT
jgi:hypothetical protein